ncbi:11S globulin seed storage protein 2-like [Chenopodium quinoa]|uniref:Cupin type-1 domain-containing protein n=1 Tax=Chenopodium quinoa TaxID=63459 RepID=A0A803M7Q1_CHEQI|nr:11S globulin seed storage protein 2-like [Chenopodium quinoa]
MGGTKILVALSLCLMVSSALGQGSHKRLSYQAQQCRINRLTSSEPNQRIECEGGLIELWDETEEQFQCSGIHAMRVTVQQNSLSLPNFHPFPRLVYIERGEGILGVTFPGCPETYDSSGRQEERIRGDEQREFGQQKDLHQKVHRFTRGDIIAIPPGAVHWCYNDGNEEVVTVIVNDLNNPSNQLDQTFRSFYLAGGLEKSSEIRGKINNIFRPFAPELLSEAFDVPEDLIRKMQQTENRGLIIRVDKGEMRILSPGSEQDYDDERRRKYVGLDVNGLEETICTMRLRHNLDNRREADVYSRHGGRLNIVNEHKLPILRHLDMSVEKGNMFPNTIYSPHWAVNSHSVVYVTRGEAHIQVVGNNGESVMDDRVNEGEMFVIPQYFTVSVKAGSNGFEYVSFKTTSSPMKSPMVGYTSVLRAMPVQVLTNAYQISPSEAHQLKYNREHQTFFLPSRGGRSRRF